MTASRKHDAGGRVVSLNTIGSFMKKYYTASVMALYLALAGYGCSTHQWKPEDMDSRRRPFVEAELLPGYSLCGFRSQCNFELHYFEGQKPTKVTPQTKYILYIPGGPGDIVDRQYPIPDRIRINEQYVYFDVRGTGYSVIPESNDYDQFLRAKYVVEDIEILRQEIAKKRYDECRYGETPLENNNCKDIKTAWDAIYAHSWGTIVAQMYAQKYGKTHVDKLILSAPVSRAHMDTEEARRTMIVKNLMDIYQTYSSVGCPWRENLSASIAEKMIKGDPAIETFCFLTKDELDLIGNELTSLLYNIARYYGSHAFVNRFYNKLIKDDEFKYGDYPAEFFTALTQLESLGGGELHEYRFQQEVRQKKIDAAFFLGYYLMLKHRPPLTDSKGKKILFDCWETTPFIQSIRNWHEKYKQPGADGIEIRTCSRIERAEEALRDPPSNGGSFRANTVFGVYDGITRWIFRLLEDQGRTENGCFKGKDLRDIANGHFFRDKKLIREIAKTIGVSNGNEEICPWDVAKYHHQVDTLILAGRADPVTAGGQAMYFYENGLAPRKRVLIDFPGAGHEMSLQVKVPSKKEKTEENPSEDEIAARIRDNLRDNFGGLLLDFLKNTSGISEFIVSDKVKKRLSELGARCKADPLPTYLESPNEPPCKPKLDDDSRQ
jgi:pimeloyl-ACP methyl ester carboxylesterase